MSEVFRAGGIKLLFENKQPKTSALQANGKAAEIIAYL